jgi:hypothetical protein
MTDNYLYAKKRVPNDMQRLVLELHREGKEPLEIGRLLRVHISSVNTIIENGVVALQSTRGRKRCGCGALLVAEPCLSCQLAGVGS